MQARGKTEPQGVQSELVRGRKWTHVGEQKQTGHQRREAIYTVRTTYGQKPQESGTDLESTIPASLGQPPTVLK